MRRSRLAAHIVFKEGLSYPHLFSMDIYMGFRGFYAHFSIRGISPEKEELREQRQNWTRRSDRWLPMRRRAVSSGGCAEWHACLPLPHVPEGGRCALHGIRTDLVLRRHSWRAVDLQKLRHCRARLLRRLRYAADLSFPP